MKKKTLFILVLTISSFAFSQKDKNIYDFFGGKLNDKKTVFYRLVFKINNNQVSGYSFTDEHGPKEEKSIIQGIYNQKTKTIVFRESQKLVTRKNNYFTNDCYLSGMIKLNITQSISKIEGIFNEETIYGEKCLNGEIKLISPDKFLYPQEKIVKKEKTPIIIEQKKEIILPNFNTNKKMTIETDDEITVFWNSNTLKLDIWDDKKEDNDQISITLNEEEILKKHVLKNKKKTIEIKLTEKENKLIFTAENTGYIGTNTARIDLIDNEIIHEIISKLDLKKSVIINIIKTN